jgi:type II secretory pathway predicted ATPase ExeA
LLCTELGQTARMRRCDNALLIRQGWQQLDRLWPVVVLDEAQNLSAKALEEIRLLTCDRRDTQPPFSLLLVGDEQLLPRLQMGINASLLSRLSFCLHLQPWSGPDLNGYLQARLEQAGIHANPFEAAASQLLLQVANGLPRLLNHLAQRALEEAALQNSRVITAAHVQRALQLLPWVAQLAP